MTLVERSHDPHVLATPSSNAARASAAEKPQPAAPQIALAERCAHGAIVPPRRLRERVERAERGILKT
jgi:hypothetical protein